MAMASPGRDFSRRRFRQTIRLSPTNFHFQLSARFERRMTAATRETDISVDIAKRITPQFGIEIGDTLSVLNPHEGQTTNGFGNLELGGKYQLLKNGTHEAIVSIGLDVEIGGTGSSSIGADSFSTWSPAIFFGKGFGDLPEALRFLKPLAITGVAGIAIPTSASTRSITVNDQTGEREIEIERHPDVLEWGFALEYSVIYLQSQVQDMHLPSPIDRLIPLVEFAMETPLNRGAGGPTTGTINPGVIWAGKYLQVGVEAVIPINEHTGNNVGVIAQLHFFLDDLFPHTIGRPLIWRKQMKSLCRIFSFCLLLILLPAQLSAHAFLEHSDPPVGGKVHSSPAAVRIWFTEVIESASSSIQVFDATGKQVDKKDMHLRSL